MNHRHRKLPLLIFVLLCGCAILAIRGSAQKKTTTWQSNIPKTWVDAEMAELEVPLADPAGSPKHISAEFYYRIPVRQVYKSYPIYHPDKEPAGYFDWLKQQQPEIAFDATKLKTEEDWIKAGEVVFDATLVYLPPITPFTDVRNPAWYRELQQPLAKDGTLPFYRYVIREKGQIEVTFDSCASCHTRVLSDGTVIKGAQGNISFAQAYARIVRQRNDVKVDRALLLNLYGAPWVKPDPLARLNEMTIEEIAAPLDVIPRGAMPRQGTSITHAPQIPDLIGLKDRRYLDHTGLQQHRGIVDLMRYDAINQFIDELTSYAGFVPAASERQDGKRPEAETLTRYSDEQLYALALYLYSLKPPPNPNQPDALARRGQRVFQSEGCALCHTPPLYTNNKLMPAGGFIIPAEHKRKYDIMPLSTGTDPNLALRTRRGTGYYKVPSLKGVWYRGPFEHNGSVATLEDWFDPHRLKDDYVPTGFKGYGVKTRAVKGHEFGLQLSAEDKRALIAFLKTL
jgi:hypothetical protein